MEDDTVALVEFCARNLARSAIPIMLGDVEKSAMLVEAAKFILVSAIDD